MTTGRKPAASAQAVLDLLLARRRDQHLHLVRAGRCGTDDLEIQIDLFQREGNVLVRLRLDLHLHFLFLQVGRKNDLLGDHCRGRQGHGHELGGGAQALPAALHRLGDHFEVGDVAVDHGIPRQGLDGVPVDATGSLAPVGQFDHLDRR